jgi:hypothetical protein
MVDIDRVGFEQALRAKEPASRANSMRSDIATSFRRTAARGARSASNILGAVRPPVNEDPRRFGRWRCVRFEGEISPDFVSSAAT